MNAEPYEPDCAPCGGFENENDGCGVTFPRMATHVSHCALCKKLKAPGISAAQRATIKACPALLFIDYY